MYSGYCTVSSSDVGASASLSRRSCFDRLVWFRFCFGLAAVVDMFLAVTVV